MKKFIILSLGLVLIAAACNKTNDQTNNENVTPTATTPPPTTPPPATTDTNTITYTSSGYSPNSLTVKKGTAVNFVNNSSINMWPASAPHPSHTEYPALDPKSGVTAGATWTFTFDRVGTWRYHDHLSPTKFGSVTVTE